MISNIKNPFIVSGYVSSEYFCDRETETKELVSSILNDRNTVLVSPRRMGKTGLVRHCFHQKQIKKEYYTFFIDIYATGSLRELVFILGKHIFQTLKPKGKKIIEQFFTIISSLRPAFKLDNITGQPVFDIGIGEIRQPLVSLEEIFKYLESANKPCIIAIDEFQQIMRYPEKNVEAILRTHIQKCKNTTFIFSGSRRHIMHNIFFSASRPFYQSASFLNLNPIALDSYRKFVHKHFKMAGKKISDNCITRIYNLLEGHTWYMQVLLNRIYEQSERKKELLISEAEAILHSTIESYATVYQGIVAMLPERQKEVLFAIAKESKISEVTSTEFIKKHSLYSPSSVQSAIRQLLDKELITRNDAVYQIYDRFFGLWLSETYGIGYSLSSSEVS